MTLDLIELHYVYCGFGIKLDPVVRYIKTYVTVIASQYQIYTVIRVILNCCSLHYTSRIFLILNLLLILCHIGQTWPVAFMRDIKKYLSIYTNYVCG